MSKFIRIEVYDVGNTALKFKVKVPLFLTKHATKLMRLIPKKMKEDFWGDEELDLGDLNLEEIVNLLGEIDEQQILEVETEKSLIKIFVE